LYLGQRLIQPAHCRQQPAEPHAGGGIVRVESEGQSVFLLGVGPIVLGFPRPMGRYRLVLVYQPRWDVTRSGPARSRSTEVDCP
jgi:hypothetical protein